MQQNEITTDRSLRELALHGTAQFPFQYYYEDMMLFQDGTIRPHWHKEFEFLTVIDGTIEVEIGNTDFSIHAGDGIFINTGVIHKMKCSGCGIIPNFVFSSSLIAPENSAIYEKYLNSFFQSGLSHLVLSRGIDWQREMLELMDEIYKLGADTAAQNQLDIHICVCRLWKVLHEHKSSVVTAVQTGLSIRSQARLHLMLQYIEEHYGDRITLADIAMSANVSKTEANRCFQLGLHDSPLNSVNTFRLSLAKEQILVTDDPLTDIAFQVGFDNYSYFNRIFKRRYGVSPSILRKNRGRDQGAEAQN